MNSETTVKNETNNSDELTQNKRKLDCVEFKRKRVRRSAYPRQRGITITATNETEYYFDNFLRKVYPYYFTYTTHCKGRWVGKRLIDVFSEEFRAHSKEEYEKNIEAGNIKIFNQKIDANYVFNQNDYITNRAHRHETAVVAAPIKIIHSCNDFIVVDKPPSVPVHPCGRYRHNCLLFILAKEHNLPELYSVHRLDRLTSGVLVLTKTIKKSQEVNSQIRDRKVKKEYVCRVDGNFPDDTVHCKEPIKVISPKVGISVVSPSGKECETVFEKMSFNGKSSVVRCMPLTGRMHQIRVHLQFLGHPIINDPIYNNEAFGPLKGKDGVIGKSEEQLLEDLQKMHNLQRWLLEDNAPLPETDEDKISEPIASADPGKENKIALSALDSYSKVDGYEELTKNYVKKPEKIIIDNACDLCHQKYMDPEPKDLILFLHSLKYKGDDWEFSTELPTWAQSDWDESKIC